MKARWPDAFDIVKELGCSLPTVEATTKYDRSPVLKVHGVFIGWFGDAHRVNCSPDHGG